MSWLSAHWTEVIRLTFEHLLLTATSLGLALLLAIPIGIWAHARPRRMGAITAGAGILYTVPSLALFAMLVPLLGLGRLPVVVGLVTYTQLILVRAVVSALDSVPVDVREAAIGMGMPRWRVLVEVDAPLAMPVFLAGVRVAAVTVIGIATIGAVVDAGGLGELILDGIQRNFPTKVLVGALGVTVLALGADWSLLRLERRARPWAAPAAARQGGS